MTTFDKREEGMEGRFAHDEEMKFKATARRDKTFGTFIAELLGKTGDEVSAYALEVIKSNMAQPGDEDMFAKVRADIDDAMLIELGPRNDLNLHFVPNLLVRIDNPKSD